MAETQPVILDTNIIIELYKGNENVRAVCEKIGEKNLYISELKLY